MVKWSLRETEKKKNTLETFLVVGTLENLIKSAKGEPFSSVTIPCTLALSYKSHLHINRTTHLLSQLKLLERETFVFAFYFSVRRNHKALTLKYR